MLHKSIVYTCSTMHYELLILLIPPLIQTFSLLFISTRFFTFTPEFLLAIYSFIFK